MDNSSIFNCDFDFGSKLSWNKILKKNDFVIFLDYWDFILKGTPVCEVKMAEGEQSTVWSTRKLEQVVQLEHEQGFL